MISRISQFSKELAAGMLRKIGLRVQRIRSAQAMEVKSLSSFYNPSPSCQIPELASLYSLFLGERSHGFFVECGAFDGISYSNSSCLADAGWNGVLIEPIPEYAKMCRERYQSNPRIQVIETAVGASEEQIDITIAGPLTTSNNLLLQSYNEIQWAKAAVSDARTISVPQKTLDAILTETANAKQIDVLIVDVEGGEDSVFKGFSFDIWRPRMVIVELVHTHPDLHSISPGDAKLQQAIQDHGYSIVYKDKINTVFVL